MRKRYWNKILSGGLALLLMLAGGTAAFADDDTTAPDIYTSWYNRETRTFERVELDGNTFYGNVTVTIEEDDLSEVSIDGVVQTPTKKEFTISGNAEKSCTVTATDGSGNTASVSFVFHPIAAIGAPLDGINADNVKSSDQSAVQNAYDTASYHRDLKGTGLVQQADLWDIEDQAQDLLDQIAATEQAIRDAKDHAGVYAINQVSADDQDEIERVIAELDVLLDGDNLTDAERGELEGEKSRLTDCLTRIDAVAAEITAISTARGKYDPAKLTAADQAGLEALDARVDTLLDGENLTAAQRQTLTTEKERIAALRKALPQEEKKPQETAKVPATGEGASILLYTIFALSAALAGVLLRRRKCVK